MWWVGVCDEKCWWYEPEFDFDWEDIEEEGDKEEAEYGWAKVGESEEAV